MTEEIKIEERGWPGHFIAGHDCRFRRNTLITLGERRIVVSTVGNYRPLSCHGEIVTIGHNRYYETMVFEARRDEPYWEADVSKEVFFDSDWSISEIDENTDGKADGMHNKVVEEIKNRMLNNVWNLSE